MYAPHVRTRDMNPPLRFSSRHAGGEKRFGESETVSPPAGLMGYDSRRVHESARFHSPPAAEAPDHGFKLVYLSVPSVRACVCGCVPRRNVESLRVLSQAALRLRQELQERQVQMVASSESEQLKRFEEFMELKQRQEFQSMRDMMERE